jgi:hypothetical protein
VGERISERVEKNTETLARLANGFLFLLTKPELHCICQVGEWFSSPLIIMFFLLLRH